MFTNPSQYTVAHRRAGPCSIEYVEAIIADVQWLIAGWADHCLGFKRRGAATRRPPSSRPRSTSTRSSCDRRRSDERVQQHVAEGREPHDGDGRRSSQERPYWWRDDDLPLDHDDERAARVGAVLPGDQGLSLGQAWVALNTPEHAGES